MMPHLSKDNTKLIKRVRRLKGQIEGIERMLNQGCECYEILQNVAASRGALNSLTKELILEHIEHHIVDETENDSIKKAAHEIQAIVNSYLK